MNYNEFVTTKMDSAPLAKRCKREDPPEKCVTPESTASPLTDELGKSMKEQSGWQLLLPYFCHVQRDDIIVDAANEQEIHELDGIAGDARNMRCKRNQCPLCLVQFDLEKCYVEHMLLVS
jgi:hypothetical protein